MNSHFRLLFAFASSFAIYQTSLIGHRYKGCPDPVTDVAANLTNDPVRTVRRAWLHMSLIAAVCWPAGIIYPLWLDRPCKISAADERMWRERECEGRENVAKQLDSKFVHTCAQGPANRPEWPKLAAGNLWLLELMATAVFNKHARCGKSR